MNEEFSFEVSPESIEELKKAINYDELNARSERFNNGTETEDDIINHCRNYEIEFENGNQLFVVEKKYFDKVIDLYQKEKALAENHKIAFEKQTENLHEVEDLYQKEKEKNKDLWKAYLDVSNDRDNNYIQKDKVKELFYKKRGLIEREDLQELLGGRNAKNE